MKAILFTSLAIFCLSAQACCQVYYDFIGIPKFSLANRVAYSKYFEDSNQLLFLDYKEGLALPCVDVRRVATTADDTSNVPNLLGKYWHAYHDFPGEGLVIYFPEGQDADNWQEQISIQWIDGQGQESRALYKLLMKERAKRCTETRSEIVEESKNYTIYKATAAQCENFAPQTELSIILTPPKMLIGQYTLWKVEYVLRNKGDEYAFSEEVLQWFRSIELLTGKSLKAYVTSK